MMAFKSTVLLVALLPSTQVLHAEILQNSNAPIHKSVYDYKPWQSGKGVAARYQVIPAAHNSQRVQSNPWKKKSFAYGAANNKQLRPWGNVPQSRARSAKGMRYFDEKFKQSSHQIDAAYMRELMSQNYSAYPGMGGMNHTYGTYPYGAYPPYRYYRNNTGLFGFMNNFMPW